METPTESGFYLAYPHRHWRGKDVCRPYIVEVFKSNGLSKDSRLMYKWITPLDGIRHCGHVETFDGKWVSQVSTIAF